MVYYAPFLICAGFMLISSFPSLLVFFHVCTLPQMVLLSSSCSHFNSSSTVRPTSIHHGSTKTSGFIFTLHNLATHPLNCNNVCTPSRIRIWQNPISRMNSNRACSLNPSTLFVTRNIVLIISWLEYPKCHSSSSVSSAESILLSQHALIIACTLIGCGESTTRKT